MTTSLQRIDVDQVAQFWKRFLTTVLVDPSTPMPDTVEPFGDSVESADELIELVIAGRKRATTSALVDYEVQGAVPPCPGAMSIATDGAGRARAVLRTTEVRIGPLNSIDERFAWDEAEGDRTSEWWLNTHEHFFRRYLPTIGVEFESNLEVVFERFEVLFAE